MQGPAWGAVSSLRFLTHGEVRVDAWILQELFREQEGGQSNFHGAFHTHSDTVRKQTPDEARAQSQEICSTLTFAICQPGRYFSQLGAKEPTLYQTWFPGTTRQSAEVLVFFSGGQPTESVGAKDTLSYKRRQGYFTYSC